MAACCQCSRVLINLVEIEVAALLGFNRLSIPVNVTADSGNVTGIPTNVTEGRCCAFLILCRLAFPAVFPHLELNCF
jgi:hypothetical protein